MAAMKRCVLLFVLLTALWPAPVAQHGRGEQKKPRMLTAEDKSFLDGLVREFLFDPRGAQRVRIKTIARFVGESAGEVTRDGWLVPAKEGQPARIYFTDGASIPAPRNKDLTQIDFVTACREYLSKAENPKRDGEDAAAAFD